VNPWSLSEVGEPMVTFKKVPMRKVNIFVAEDDIVKVIVVLGRLRTLDLIDTGNDQGWDTGRGGHWAEVADRYASLTRRLESLTDALGLDRHKASEPEALAPQSDADHLQKEIDELQDCLHDWQERRQQAERRVKQLDLALQGLRVLAPLDLPVEKACQSDHLHLVFGALPRESIASLKVALFPIPFVIVPFAERKDRTFVYAASAQDDAAVLDRALKSAFFDPLTLPEDAVGRPAGLAHQFEQRLREAEDRLEQVQAERAQLANERGPSILRHWRQALMDARIAETVSHLERHEGVFLIAGWVSEKELQRLVQRLRDVALLVTVLESKTVAPSPDQGRSFLATLAT
jgi:vacuolar-type H+-ATPase subunit I/STV1